ncbi:MAG: HAD hydrolase-like protein [Clostridia bacterium]|nr:HAD hydrolase-like protein [Clostridia bacterium]
MSYRYIFFDLDGTLVNSRDGITASVSYALQKSGLTPPPRETLTSFIGPPLVYGFSHFAGMNEEDALAAVGYYREYYQVKGIFECRLYEGVREMIQALRQKGLCLVLATCKPTVYATRILEHFDLLQYFTMVSGPELDGTRNEKEEVIEYALQALAITDPSDVIMIGDRHGDVEGALKHNVDCYGVLWGFGDESELLEAGATKLYKTAEALCKDLLT